MRIASEPSIDTIVAPVRLISGQKLLTENRRRALGGAYFDAGMTEKAEELFRSWLDADPGWGWAWIGW